MAEEKKQRKIISASTGQEVSAEERKQAVENAKKLQQAKPTGNATGLRIGAILLWILAIGFEVFAILELLQGKPVIGGLSTLAWAIIALALDLVCVIIGSQLWKKANHIKPASEKNKFLFWLYNNLGVIISIIAFLPFIILILTDKNSNKKTKIIAVVVAVVALLIGGVASYDFNPISQEQQAAAEAALGADTPVYWAPFGKVYHTHDDCQALNKSDSLTFGTVDEAIAANKTRLCKYCAKKDNINTEGLLTDGEASDADIVTEAPATVYWADGVDGYHLNPDCSAFDALDEDAALSAGTIEQAAAAGHGTACPDCGK